MPSMINTKCTMMTHHSAFLFTERTVFFIIPTIYYIHRQALIFFFSFFMIVLTFVYIIRDVFIVLTAKIVNTDLFRNPSWI